MHIDSNEESSLQDEELQLEFKSQLLNQLLEVIRASSPKHDDQMADIIRSAETYEGLKRQLDQFKTSMLATDGKSAKMRGIDQTDHSAEDITSTNSPSSLGSTHSATEGRA